MKLKKRIGVILITGLLLLGLTTSCGIFGTGPRDGRGPQTNAGYYNQN